MVSATVYISVMLYAMSSWIGLIGVGVEQPLLVNVLPEAWELPSYLVIIVQCANLGPAIYAIWDKIVRQRRQQSQDEQQQQQQSRLHQFCNAEVVMSLIIILTSIVSMLLLSILWNYTINRSVLLLTLVSFASLSSCTSSVVFLPYMARFPSVYISAYYFGIGLCGLIPGLLGLAQIAGEEPQCSNETNINDTAIITRPNSALQAQVVYYSSPRFSVSEFFLLITILLCISAVAFCCLNFVHKCRSEMTVSTDEDRQQINAGEGVAASETTGLLESIQNPDSDGVQIENVYVHTTPTLLQRYRFLSLFVTTGIISALSNSILPATGTYTCLPYGNIVYRLSVCLFWVVTPLATLPNMLAPTSSVPLIIGLGSIATLLSALHLLLAAQSPHPILQGTVTGQVIVVSLFYHHSFIIVITNLLSSVKF